MLNRVLPNSVTHLAAKHCFLTPSTFNSPVSLSPAVFPKCRRSSRLCYSSRSTTSAIMSSAVQHEWNAVRVRETFLDYFKKNGHEFGRTRLVTKNSELDHYLIVSAVQYHHPQSSHSQIRHCSSQMLA